MIIFLTISLGRGSNFDHKFSGAKLFHLCEIKLWD